jgi:hypothetical protein
MQRTPREGCLESILCAQRSQMLSCLALDLERFAGGCRIGWEGLHGRVQFRPTACHRNCAYPCNRHWCSVLARLMPAGAELGRIAGTHRVLNSENGLKG